MASVPEEHMSRRRQKRKQADRKSDADRFPTRTMAAAWWPLALFAGGLAAALIVRQFILPADRTADRAPPTTSLPTARPPKKPASSDPDPSPRAATSSEASPEAGGHSPTELRFAEHLGRGYADFKNERYADALEELTTASKIDPSVPDTYHFMGEVYRNLLLMDKAQQLYRKALAVNPHYTLSRKNLAMVLYEAGKYEDAVGLLTSLRKEYPGDTFVLGELAINAIALGKPAEAIELLKQYNRVEGEQAWGYAQLGRAYADAGNDQKAEQAYRRAIAIDPRFALAHYWLGQLLAATGRQQQAKQPLAEYRRLRKLQDQSHQLKMALLRTPDDLRTLVALAHVRYLLGKPRQSLVMLKRALHLTPNDQKLLQLYRQVAASIKGKPAGKRD